MLAAESESLFRTNLGLHLKSQLSLPGPMQFTLSNLVANSQSLGWDLYVAISPLLPGVSKNIHLLFQFEETRAILLPAVEE